MIFFAGALFFDSTDLKIDWKAVELLWYRNYYASFTDRKRYII